MFPEGTGGENWVAAAAAATRAANLAASETVARAAPERRGAGEWRQSGQWPAPVCGEGHGGGKGRAVSAVLSLPAAVGLMWRVSPFFYISVEYRVSVESVEYSSFSIHSVLDSIFYWTNSLNPPCSQQTCSYMDPSYLL